jgi:murein DD-endopeptidase MepM/ murein hydrolase activator NlpD
VRADERVVAGQLLAQVGNSGGTDEAHLHIHVQRAGTPDAPMSGEPLPALFFGRFLVRGDRLKISGG